MPLLIFQDIAYLATATPPSGPHGKQHHGPGADIHTQLLMAFDIPRGRVYTVRVGRQSMILDITCDMIMVK